jgi:uncharacterized UBP type Zn finger protein
MTSSLGDHIRRVLFQRSFARRSCAHVAAVGVAASTATTCRGCDEEGTRAVHLRMCLTCGYVGCCDSSRAAHARRHHDVTGHPTIRSVEPGERWVWCYVDRAYLASLEG